MMSTNRDGYEIGVLGAGRMGLRLAAMFARAGRRVIVGSRDPAGAAAKVASLDAPGGIGVGSYEHALDAGAILPAIFLRDGLDRVLSAYRRSLRGKLLIDISNPFNADYSDYILPWDTSSAEVLQELLPEARLVGAFKHVFAEVFDAPVFEGAVRSDVLILGDDAGAKQEFLALARGTPFRYLDAGPLVFARAVERMTIVTGRLGRQLGSYPRMNWRLLGERQAG